MHLNIHVADTLGIPTDSFKDIIASAEAYQSSESFNTSLRNVLDLFIRTGNVLKVSVTRMNRQVKRGELEKYINDHTLVVKSIEKLSYFDAQDTSADIPHGMKGKYIDAINMLQEVFSKLDTQAMVNIAYDSFNHIRTNALRKESINAEVENLNATLSIKKPFISDAMKKMNAVFSTVSRTPKFQEVFASMEEFREVKTKTLAAEQYLTQAQELSKTTSKLATLVTDITALSDVQITKEESNSLADSAMVIAKLLDLYGSASMNLMSVSHNLTLIYNTLYTKVK